MPIIALLWSVIEALVKEAVKYEKELACIYRLLRWKYRSQEKVLFDNAANHKTAKAGIVLFYILQHFGFVLN